MKLFTVRFEHSKWGTTTDCVFRSRNETTAIVKGAKMLGLKAKLINKCWQFWREGIDGINVYLLKDIYSYGSRN